MNEIQTNGGSKCMFESWPNKKKWKHEDEKMMKLQQKSKLDKAEKNIISIGQKKKVQENE